MTEPRLLGGRYELAGLVGKGGMAEVWRGRDRRLGRTVAIKMLRSDLAMESSFQVQFRREAQSVAALSHPSIVAVYAIDEEVLNGARNPFIVMEYVEGRSMRRMLSEHSHDTPQRSLEIVSGILEAVDYGHRAGFVHGDIKPGNVLITSNGGVKVKDFGIARAVADTEADMTETPAVIGTVQYLSPEQARGERADARSDIYATGCLLYELLTGRPPFVGDSPVSVAYQHVREDPVPPSQLDPEIPPVCDAIVLKALAKYRLERYQSAAEMRALITRALASLSAPTSAQNANAVLKAAQSRRSAGLLPKPVTVKNPAFINPRRVSRREEAYGDEEYVFDNSKSLSTSVETIHATHTAKVEIVVDTSRARSADGQAGVRFIDLASIEGRIRQEVLTSHHLSLSQQLVYEQTTSITIPAATHVRVVLHWKRVWEEGVVTLGERADVLAEVPYAVTVGLRFSKETADIA